MLTGKPWRAESVLLLAAGLMISISAAGLMLLLGQKYLPSALMTDTNYLQFLVSTAGFHGASFLLVHFFLRQHEVRWSEFFGLKQGRPMSAILLGAVAGIGVLPFALGLNVVSGWLLNQIQVVPVEQQAVHILRSSQSLGQYICFGLAAMVLAPIVEEMLFRGILYSFLKQFGRPGMALWVSSLFFAIIHANVMTFIPLTFLGLILVWLYERSQCLLAPIAAHAAFNAANFAMLVVNFDPARGWNP